MTDHKDHDHSNIVNLRPEHAVELEEFSCEYAQSMVEDAMDTITDWQQRHGLPMSDTLQFFGGAIMNLMNFSMHQVPDGADIEAIVDTIKAMRKKRQEQEHQCEEDL